MNRDYVLKYSPALLQSAAVSYIKQLIGPVFPVVFIGLSIYSGIQVYNEDYSWRVGLAGGGVFIVGAIIISLFIGHLKHAKTTANELRNGETIFGLSESGISFSSPLGFAEIPWGQISSLHQHKDFFILLVNRGNYTSVPLASIDDEAMEFIRKSVLKHGGKVA
ncbi:YcxB family protein [Microbulbifer sp. TRSA001]|uniref:YcxB family protein n=1 Tax=Microbulbifer sp. TRSA001 TaxID=3243381 RepID=UPI004038FBAA